MKYQTQNQNKSEKEEEEKEEEEEEEEKTPCYISQDNISKYSSRYWYSFMTEAEGVGGARRCILKCS